MRAHGPYGHRALPACIEASRRMTPPRGGSKRRLALPLIPFLFALLHPHLQREGRRRASRFSRSFRPELWFGRVEGCAGRDGSILIYRREPIGAPRAVAAPTPGPGLARRRSDE